jgi:hypothetical protein
MKHNSWTYLMLLFITIGCEEVIDFQTDDRPQLVIYGKISNAQSHTPSVFVERSAAGFEKRAPISNAIVRISDESGNVFSFTYRPGRERYFPEREFVGQPGVAYQLSVELEGKIYLSSWERMPLHNVIDSGYYSIETLEGLSSEGVLIDFEGVKLYKNTLVPDLPEPLYIRWDIEEVYLLTSMSLPTYLFPFHTVNRCYIFEQFFPEEIPLFTTENNNINFIENQLLGTRRVDRTCRNTLFRNHPKFHKQRLF